MYVQAAACDTVKVFVAMLIVPARRAGVCSDRVADGAVARARRADVIVIHGVAVVAVQLQSAAVDTAIGTAVPPESGGDGLVGSIVETQAPACVTVKFDRRC